jgi:hypothetical protein
MGAEAALASLTAAAAGLHSGLLWLPGAPTYVTWVPKFKVRF